MNLPGLTLCDNRPWIAIGAQQQSVTMFTLGGQTIIHPEPARFFEVPIKGPLPEELNYIP